MACGRDATVLDDLPESIIVEEILVRLPAKDVLRCRAVRKSWRHATSTNNFVLAHYRRQPSVPIINLFKRTSRGNDCIFSLINDSSATTIDRKLRGRTILRCSASRTGKERLDAHAACDGLFIVSIFKNKEHFFVCNPTTHQRAPLQLHREHSLPNRRIQIAAFYQHRPSGEYRVLYCIRRKDEEFHTVNVDFYVLVVGSDESRTIGQLPVSPMLLDGLTCSCNAPVLHRGSLHWDLEGYSYDLAQKIMVFDTILETFRWMRHPSHSYLLMSLLEMNDRLAMCCSHGWVTINIYFMQDYTAEIWALTHRIHITNLEGQPPVDYRNISVMKIVAFNERELLIKLQGGCVLHCDIDGKFLGMIKHYERGNNYMDITTYRFRENIIPLPFFDTQDDSGSSMIPGERGDDMWP